MVKILPFLVSKTPIRSEPSKGAINEKSILIFTIPPFGFNPCGRKTCILVSEITYFAATSVTFPLEEVTNLTDLIL